MVFGLFAAVLAFSAAAAAAAPRLLFFGPRDLAQHRDLEQQLVRRGFRGPRHWEWSKK